MQKTPTKRTLWFALSLIVLLMVALLFGRGLVKGDPVVSAITRDGVVTEIQSLSRLTTVAFSVDTVITSQKEGTWQKLWQDKQKALFVATGRVQAGVDLSKLTAEMVTVTYDEQTDPKIAPTAHINVVLPSSEIFDLYLDNIQMYDWQTGLFGLAPNDAQVLALAQSQGKAEVLKKACQGGIMTIAQDNAKEQIKALFHLTGAQVTVETGKPLACAV